MNKIDNKIDEFGIRYNDTNEQVNKNKYTHDLRCNSYITKDELINMISNIHFEYVKHIHMDLITGYIINSDDQDIKPLYYTIDID